VIGQALLDYLVPMGDLCPEDRDAVLRMTGERRTFRRNEDIAKSGAPPAFSIVVVTGFLQRYVSRRDGSRQIHAFYLPGDAPALESVHLDCLDSSLGAAATSEVVLIPVDDLAKLMAERPRVQDVVWKSSLVQSAQYREWLTRNSRLTADAAMAHMFCEIYKRAEAAGLVEQHSCEMPLTQEMVGDALGLTGVHVNRTLQHLRDTGYVDHHRGRLYMHDFDRLSSLAEFDPAYLRLRKRRAR
jgi:CRP-like cAMP-binding protein